jgi:hypothetical protein
MAAMKSFGRRLVFAAIVLAVGLGGWLALIRSDAPTVIDGYTLGEPAQCASRCERYGEIARAWLDEAVPGHAETVITELWTLDRILMVRSGGRDYVVLLRLADGTTRAVVVGCGVGIDPDRCFTVPGSPYR